MSKKRGAQLGNKNALKHGFYSSSFKEHELHALNQTSLTSTFGEIELMRVSLKRFLEAQNASSQPLDLETQLSQLRAINQTTYNIDKMIRTQFMLALSAKQSKEIIQRFKELSIEEDMKEEMEDDLDLPPVQ